MTSSRFQLAAGWNLRKTRKAYNVGGEMRKRALVGHNEGGSEDPHGKQSEVTVIYQLLTRLQYRQPMIHKGYGYPVSEYWDYQDSTHQATPLMAPTCQTSQPGGLPRDAGPRTSSPQGKNSYAPPHELPIGGQQKRGDSCSL